MKRLLMFLALPALLALGACNVPDPAVIAPGITVTTLPAPVTYQNKSIQTVEAAIVTAQAATVKACRYRPAASFLLKVAATFTSFDEALSYVDTLAARTCVAAGATVRTADAAGPPTAWSSLSTQYSRERMTGRVRGVPVEGEFLS